MWNAHIFEEFQVARKKAHTCRLHEVYMSTFTLLSPWMKIASNANLQTDAQVVTVVTASADPEEPMEELMPTCRHVTEVVLSLCQRHPVTLAWHWHDIPLCRIAYIALFFVYFSTQLPTIPGQADTPSSRSAPFRSLFPNTYFMTAS